jgi:hypothetical protein
LLTFPNETVASQASGSSGGIYDEARRGFFLGEQFKNPKAAKGQPINNFPVFSRW